MRPRRFLLLLVAILPLGKRFVYRRLFGARIGRGVRIGFGAILLFDEMSLESFVKISPFCVLDAENISIGLRSRIGRFVHVSINSFSLGPSCTISSQVSIKGDRNDLRSSFSAEAECWIFEYCYINVARPVRMERNVGVGGGSYIFTHGVWLSQLHGYPVSYGEVTIGKDVWLPWGCFIMPGVDIGDGCVVGARSLVSKSIPAGALAAGTPAKVLRERANVEVTLQQRTEMLSIASMEYCAKRGYAFRSKPQQDWIVFEFNGTDQVAIATVRRADHTLPSIQGLLRVVHEPFQSVNPIRGAIYSSESFQCTPRTSFNGEQADWLQHLRTIGVRHYPLDEVSVE